MLRRNFFSLILAPFLGRFIPALAPRRTQVETLDEINAITLKYINASSLTDTFFTPTVAGEIDNGVAIFNGFTNGDESEDWYGDPNIG